MINSPYLDVLQSHHQFQGSSNDCGPFCTATAVNVFHQKQIKGTDLGLAMNRVKWKVVPTVRRIPNWATLPWGVVDILKEEKLKAHWLVFQKCEKLLDLLARQNILIVIIGNYRPMWSHYKILAAFDSTQGYGFVDSAFRSSDLQWNTTDYFEKHWRKYGSQVIQIYP